MTTLGALLDRETMPSVEDFAAACGPERGWFDRLVRWLETTYGAVGEPLFSGRESGWTLRFRRSGRALLTLMPLEDGRLRVLVVIGPSAWRAVAGTPLSEPIRDAWASAYPYPDGRWLWPIVDSEAVLEDIERLVALKSPPPRRVRALAEAGVG